MTAFTQWLAVRCCCQGERVLGFLNVPAKVQGGKLTVFERVSAPDVMTALQSLPLVASNVPRHVVELRRFGHELAVYSEDRPVEFWRKLHGFIEARQP